MNYLHNTDATAESSAGRESKEIFYDDNTDDSPNFNKDSCFEPSLSLVEQYKTTFDCCVKKLFNNGNCNVKEDISILQEIFHCLWDDHCIFIQKFKDVEENARLQINRNVRKLEQDKAVKIMENDMLQQQQLEISENTLSWSNQQSIINELDVKKFCVNNNHDINYTEKVTRLTEELNISRKEVERLQLAVTNGEAGLARFQDKINSMTAKFEDSKWALVKEVANKHDELLNLQRKMTTIEETSRKAESQALYKDGIIKHMRVQLNALKERPKLCDIVCEVQNKQNVTMIPQNTAELLGGGDAVVDQLPLPGSNAADAHTSAAIMESSLTIDDIGSSNNQTDYFSTIDSLEKMKHLTGNEADESAAACEIDDILRGLRVDWSGGADIRLMPRINMLQHAIFDVCLPELHAQLQAEKKMVANKEETVQNLQGIVSMREEQVETFKMKVIELERQLEQQRAVIAELQQAVQNCKQLECNLHEKEISLLKFELCEWDGKRKSLDKEIKNKTISLANACEETLRLKTKLNYVSNKLQELEPEVLISRRMLLKTEKYNKKLEQDLLERQNEIEGLQRKVQKLEEESDKSESGRIEFECQISTLKEKVNDLQSELSGVREEYLGLLSEAESRYVYHKTRACLQHKELSEKYKVFQKLIQQMHEENEALTKQTKQDKSYITMLLEKERMQQVEFQKRLSDMEHVLKEQETLLKGARVEGLERANILEIDNQKKAEQIKGYHGIMEEKGKIENELRNKLKQYRHAIETLQCDNEIMKKMLVERDDELIRWENGELSDLNELEAKVLEMAKANSTLSSKCVVLQVKFDEMYTIRRFLQNKLKSQSEIIIKLSEKCREWDNIHHESQEDTINLKKELQEVKKHALVHKTRAETYLQQLKEQITHLQKVEEDYVELRGTHCKLRETLKGKESAKTELATLLRATQEDKRQLEGERNELLAKLEHSRNDCILLQDKIISLEKKLTNDNISLAENYGAVESQLKKAQTTIIKYEEEILPTLKFKMDRKDKIIHTLKTEVDEANLSCSRMRDEANQLLENLQGSNRENDRRQSASIAQGDKMKIGACNPWSPCPPAAHAIWVNNLTSHNHTTSLRDSPDYYYESGFQSRGTSPSPQPE